MPKATLVNFKNISFRIFFLTITFSALVFTTPALAEDFNFAGLKDTVTVYEDALGVPTIVGSSESDVAFIQGYIHARDRFFQMDYFRRLGSGRQRRDSPPEITARRV